ncbi:MAG TPA: ScpA family protein [Dehalococcoidia bacterium]|nr:ScpA family protein [Dehalococcoidia bacterium]
MTGAPVLWHHPFSVTLDVFEGPLDLLLSLVHAARLEITDVSLVTITSQYLAYMRELQQVDHRDLADFVAIGARLIELKSRALLPSPPPLEPSEDAEPDAESLAELLRRYQQFKQAAAVLREREAELVRAFPRLAPLPDVPPLPGLSQVTLERMAAIVGRALARAEPPPGPGRYARPQFSLRQKMHEIAAMLRIGGRLRFARLVDECRSRDEIIVLFFAVLEMVKARVLVPVQPELFGEILLVSAPPEHSTATNGADTLAASTAVAANERGSETELAGVEDAERIGGVLDRAQEVHA